MVDLAWFAGYFEGEGTLTISLYTRRGYTRPIVTLTSVDPATIALFHERWPGYMQAHQPKGNARLAHTWTLNARPMIRRFLVDLAPYWVTGRVRAKADLLLADINARVQGAKDPAYMVACRARRDQMRLLNMRGVQ